VRSLVKALHAYGAECAEIKFGQVLCPEAQGLQPSAQGFNPHKRYLNARPFDGRMAFVPEGQADRSQARSAWVGMQRAPVPEGRPKSWSVPEKFVVETEVHDALETLGIPVERYAGV
jgi:hypothetical protein